MRHLHEPLTLPTHPVLLHEINEMSINIKVHHIGFSSEDMKGILELRLKRPEPSWSEVVELLRKCYDAINEQRENPRKY